ncbi:hypothetical protein [Bradyrhizobium sp.]|uniref:hypothetical protein n=1 Tax=Bradyrhizobium sp. TaxID=376 RepID=UPI002E032B65|nr:hypothetical protein [Bradyrhizobium sp.]
MKGSISRRNKKTARALNRTAPVHDCRLRGSADFHQFMKPEIVALEGGNIGECERRLAAMA